MKFERGREKGGAGRGGGGGRGGRGVVCGCWKGLARPKMWHRERGGVVGCGGRF